MKNFNLYSAQTGSSFGTVQAINETDALNKFAQRHGFESAWAMWAAGRFEYVSAGAA
jgi:hypothetical protein